MSAWTDFVKTHYHKVAHLPNKERFKALSAMRKSGAKGGGLISDIAHGAGSIADVFGLGMDMKKKKRTRKAKGGVLTAGALPEEHGAGFLSGALGALGL